MVIFSNKKIEERQKNWYKIYELVGKYYEKGYAINKACKLANTSQMQYKRICNKLNKNRVTQSLKGSTQNDQTIVQSENMKGGSIKNKFNENKNIMGDIKSDGIVDPLSLNDDYTDHEYSEELKQLCKKITEF